MSLPMAIGGAIGACARGNWQTSTWMKDQVASSADPTQAERRPNLASASSTTHTSSPRSGILGSRLRRIFAGLYCHAFGGLDSRTRPCISGNSQDGTEGREGASMAPGWLFHTYQDAAGEWRWQLKGRERLNRRGLR